MVRVNMEFGCENRIIRLKPETILKTSLTASPWFR